MKNDDADHDELDTLVRDWFGLVGYEYDLDVCTERLRALIKKRTEHLDSSDVIRYHELYEAALDSCFDSESWHVLKGQPDD